MKSLTLKRGEQHLLHWSDLFEPLHLEQVGMLGEALPTWQAGQFGEGHVVALNWGEVVDGVTVPRADGKCLVAGYGRGLAQVQVTVVNISGQIHSDSLDVVSQKTGGVIRFPIRTGFSKKQETNDIKVKRADGVTDNLVIPDGWTGTLDFERASSALDDYFANMEADYYNGKNNDVLSITETIVEANGAVTQYRFTAVALKYSDAGSWQGDSTVKQKVDWMASKRLKIA